MDNRGVLGWLEGRVGLGLNHPFILLPPSHLGQTGSVQLLLWDPVFTQGPSFMINALIGVALQEAGRCLLWQHIHQEAGGKS